MSQSDGEGKSSPSPVKKKPHQSCQDILCERGLDSREKIVEWLKDNKPVKTKDQKPTKEERQIWAAVKRCLGKKKVCIEGAKRTPTPVPKPKKVKDEDEDEDEKEIPESKRREKIFNVARTTANWAYVNPDTLQDSPLFDGEAVKSDLEFGASTKLEAMLNLIRKLDAEDMAADGKHQKHFIFSDVKTGGYGAKIVAAALEAYGYFNKIGVTWSRKTLKNGKTQNSATLHLKKTPEDERGNAFSVLTSSSLYGAPVGDAFKRGMLAEYNSRPENVYGQSMRFIVFDSGFKEGIDLFDVKYVHIYEPSMTLADLKQTVGRATRTCGQKGLRFQPGIGWPLYVQQQKTTVPEDIGKFQKGLEGVESVFDIALENSTLEKALLNLGEQLWELAPNLSVDQQLTRELHKHAHDLRKEFENDAHVAGDFLVAAGAGGEEQAVQGGGARPTSYVEEGATGGARASGGAKLRRQLSAGGVKCSTPGDVPLHVLRKAFEDVGGNLKLVPKSKEGATRWLARYARSNEAMCAMINREMVMDAAELPRMLEGMSVGGLRKLEALDLVHQQLHKPVRTAEDQPELEYSGKAGAGSAEPVPPSRKLGMNAMRDQVRQHFGRFAYPPIKIENHCAPRAAAAADAAAGEALEKKHHRDRLISQSPTQDFIRHFFTPASPQKGMLLWHSVGTGKTCTAIATESSTFEREGYTILWVTRTTLKADVWKNMFDMICHAIIAEEVAAGKLVPEKMAARRRMLSDRWIEPISQKQFTNLLTGSNKFQKILEDRNGKEDVLRKTLCIIDEAHKLYGGDLKASEKPDMEKMEDLLQKSQRVSGRDSVRLMLMTATPFTSTPMEFMRIMNLMREPADGVLRTKFHEFKEHYMTKDGALSKPGVRQLANELSGQISQLDRSGDPRQFSQPQFIDVPVVLGHWNDRERPQAFKGKYVAPKQKATDAAAPAKEMRDDAKEELKEAKAAARGATREGKAAVRARAKEEKAAAMARYREKVAERRARLTSRRAALMDRKRTLRASAAARKRGAKRDEKARITAELDTKLAEVNAELEKVRGELKGTTGDMMAERAAEQAEIEAEMRDKLEDVSEANMEGVETAQEKLDLAKGRMVGARKAVKFQNAVRVGDRKNVRATKKRRANQELMLQKSKIVGDARMQQIYNRATEGYDRLYEGLMDGVYEHDLWQDKGDAEDVPQLTTRRRTLRRRRSSASR